MSVTKTVQKLMTEGIRGVMNALNMEILYYKKTSEIQKHFVDRNKHPFH